MLFTTAVWKRALLCWGLLLLPSAASAFNVRLTWQPVVGAHGYRLHVATGLEGYGAPTDLGALAPDPDGKIRHVQTGLTASAAHRFAITSYDDGGESPRSNELTLAYAIVAALLDSDDDGLTDAVEDVDLDGITGPAETDRLRYDTDGDGIGDGAERATGTDPRDPGDPGAATGTCAAPLTIAAGGGTYVQTTAGPSALAGSCAPSGGPERVFRWTPAASGRATIETCSGTGTSFDTVLYLRRGDCAGGTEVACNDDTATCVTAEPSTYHGSRLQPLVAAGETYFVVVDGDDDGGTFTLRVIAPEPPSATPIGTATAAPTPTRTRTPTPARTATPTRTTTRTPTPARTATRTPTPARTATPIHTAAATERPTPTPDGAPLETPHPDPLPTSDPAIDATSGWYRCHRARAAETERTPPIELDATDGFEPIAGTVRRLRALCPALPAVETAEASPPLARYAFRQSDGLRRPFQAGVANVLGEALLAVGRATAIHVVAAADDTEPSVAVCRRVLERNPAPPRLLAVRTAEGVERYVVGAPQRLCTAEAGEPEAPTGAGALLCYQARRERDPAAPPLDEAAPVENAFGVGGTALQPVAELCVPTEIVAAAPADS